MAQPMTHVDDPAGPESAWSTRVSHPVSYRARMTECHKALHGLERVLGGLTESQHVAVISGAAPLCHCRRRFGQDPRTHQTCRQTDTGWISGR